MTTASDLRLRSQLLGTQVISQGTATRLGIVSQIWADLDRRQVVVISAREQAFTGVTLSMMLERAAAVGRDAILVTGDEVFEDLDLAGLSRVVGSEVITETGTRLGKVKDFEFDAASGEITSLILSNLGIPLLPGFLLSTYQMTTDEIESLGQDRIIVADGAETRLTQIGKSFLEQFGLGKAPWEQATNTPILPSSAESLKDRDEEYDEKYEEEYEDEDEEEELVDAEETVYAEEEEEDDSDDLTPAAVAPNWKEEYAEPVPVREADEEE